MKKMDPVVHFEMPAQDRKRMADFYSNVFGWQATMMGEEMGNYVTVKTAEVDENGMSKVPGTINGGFFPITPEMTDMHPSIVISVDNINTAMEKVEGAGGEVLGEPVEIPGIGKYVSFIDTEGNRASLLQPGR